MQGILGLLGLIAFITVYFFLPETSQPGARGIDKMRAANEIDSSKSFIFINPLRSLSLFRSPIMLSIVSSWVLSSNKSVTRSTEYHINCYIDVLVWWGSWKTQLFIVIHNLWSSVIGPIGIHNCNVYFFTAVAIELMIYPKGIRYHITNGALIGACFLPSGLGSIGS